MLRYIYGRDIGLDTKLQASMHRDRADQFKRRLGWEVTVDDRGWEIDEYDRDDTLYVIWVMPDGTHGGSMRFVPSSGQTMVNDHFSDLLGDRVIDDPLIWECTRYCLREGVPSRVAAALMLGGGELMRAFHLTHLLGVFDARMIRIYRMIGSSPEVLGSSGTGRDQISVGLWQYRPIDRVQVLRRAAVSSDVSEHWFQRSMGRPVILPKAA
ncbi:autoinducer synthase [Loktanella sp. F6476L]|uniref:acyl-homoserine-lactone synthase n=1 Tax=Loktanella sp. F6476L TaxID=2926405 RepID=UPI001FF179EC|nr:acyl-homoserine-lactone synthase [Loktanella sp. F6476L]MCK0120211.1 autoinducer synthase [Loktanella sp. F6476L]